MDELRSKYHRSAAEEAEDIWNDIYNNSKDACAHGPNCQQGPECTVRVLDRIVATRLRGIAAYLKNHIP